MTSYCLVVEWAGINDVSISRGVDTVRVSSVDGEAESGLSSRRDPYGIVLRTPYPPLWGPSSSPRPMRGTHVCMATPLNPLSPPRQKQPKPVVFSTQAYQHLEFCDLPHVVDATRI